MEFNKEDIIEALYLVNDPELGIDIYTLGLIRKVDVTDEEVLIEMTFTTPACPHASYLLNSVKKAVHPVTGDFPVRVRVDLSKPYEPPDEIKEILGIL